MGGTNLIMPAGNKSRIGSHRHLLKMYTKVEMLKINEIQILKTCWMLKLYNAFIEIKFFNGVNPEHNLYVN